MDMAVKHDEDSIALMLIGTNEIQAEIVAKRIHKAVNHLVLNDQKINEKYTLSIGIAEMADEDYAELLIGRTQAALDRALNDGGNQTSH
jgi:GGDEF domain-containing protein